MYLFETSFIRDQISTSNTDVGVIPSQDKVNQQILGFNNETQGWFPCKIVETAPQEKLWTVDWWDSGKEMSTLSKHGWNIWAMENRSRMTVERLDQDEGKHEM